MKVFLTGATGFIGAFLAARLCAQGHQVRALVRPKSKMSKICSLPVEPVIGDMRDEAGLTRFMAGSDIVYHLARSRGQSLTRKRDYFATNLDGAKSVMAAAIAANVGHVVFGSSTGVYGRQETLPISEDHHCKPSEVWHDQSKYADETLVKQMAAAHGQSLVVARIAQTIGPGDRRFAKFFSDVVNSRFILYGPSDAYIHFADVDDAVEGLVLCGYTRSAKPQIYNLAGPQAATLSATAKYIADAAGIEFTLKRRSILPFSLLIGLANIPCRALGIELPHSLKVDFYKRHRAFDVSKARRDLGFAPKFGLAATVKRTLAWYRQEGLI